MVSLAPKCVQCYAFLRITNKAPSPLNSPWRARDGVAGSHCVTSSVNFDPLNAMCRCDRGAINYYVRQPLFADFFGAKERRFGANRESREVRFHSESASAFESVVVPPPTVDVMMKLPVWLSL